MQRNLRAFTLVELLVVVGIIGILVAALLPAIVHSREAARRTECINNQRNLALAVLNFEHVHKYFPGYANIQATDADGTLQRTGWAFMLLPYMEGDIIAQGHGPRGPAELRGLPPNAPVAGMRCPSDNLVIARGSNGALTASSYVANVGQVDAQATNLLPADWRANGIFVNRFPLNDSNNRVRTESVTAKYVAASDGSAKTLLLSENLDAGFWTDSTEAAMGFAWEATLVDGVPAPTTLLRINEAGGDQWASIAATQSRPHSHGLNIALACINCGPQGPRPRPVSPVPDTGPNPEQPAPPPDEVDSRMAIRYARPSSHHGGGVVAAYADAHVDFLSDEIDYVVYAALMSPKQHAATMPGTLDAVPELYRTATAGR